MGQYLRETNFTEFNFAIMDKPISDYTNIVLDGFFGIAPYTGSDESSFMYQLKKSG